MSYGEACHDELIEDVWTLPQEAWGNGVFHGGGRRDYVVADKV